MFLEPKSSNFQSKHKDKDVYLSDREKMPPWLSAIALTAVILLSVLWLLPQLFSEPVSRTLEENEVNSPVMTGESEIKIEVGEKVLVKVGECPLYDSAERGAIRLSTALYGESADVLAVEGRFAKLRLEDGFTAWAELEKLSSDFSALSPENIRYKILLLSPYKQVMSHSMNGHVLFKVHMGTYLYADHIIADIIRLRLPDGQHGWINQSGVQILEMNDKPAVPNRAAELFVSTAMNFNRSPYVPGAMGKEGVDMAGIVYIAARINGLDLPRTLAEQAKQGQSVQAIKDPETGLIRPELLETGDVIFFHEPNNSEKINRAAIILEEGQALCRLSNDSIVMIRDLNRQNGLLEDVATIRRYFK